jgi:hypothetical protein
MNWPVPLTVSRWRSAAMIAEAAYNPVSTSTIETPTFIGPAPGSPSGMPETLIIPLMAWKTPS